MSDLSTRAIEILAQMASMSTEEITSETTFEYLALDSLDLVELTLILEDELGVQLDQNVLVELVTVQDALDAVEKRGTIAV